MIILSIHLGHDSSVCILNNGNLDKYFLVERYTRKKHDDDRKFILNLVSGISAKLKEKLDVICVSNFNSQDGFILTLFEKCKKYNPNIKLVLQQDHHLNHASLAFYNSKFDESLVVVVDGAGSTVRDTLKEVESVFSFNCEKNTLIYKNVIKDVLSPYNFTPENYKHFLNMWTTNSSPSEETSDYECKNIFSVGTVYDIAAILMGYTPNDCGKPMGLSSYGVSNKLFENIFLEGNTLNNSFFKNSSQEIQYFLTNPIEEITKDNYKLYADFCYEVQQQTQTAVGDLIEDSIKKTGIKRVCISGGYGMNIIANHYYLQRFPDVEFYFEPVCNDNGISIGAAMNAYIQVTGKIPNPIQKTFFHGTYHDISQYTGTITSIKEIANLLNRNKSIAVYKGLAEAGQRALGNRSILFNALNPNAKDIVNNIKKREWYRPFACIVLEEDANIYFDMGRVKSSSFMTICFSVREKYVKILPGITHVDNTCRIQTVSKTDGYLYELLQEFKELSGHGILLNTSFNLAGEPLVETPMDALNTLNNSSLDYLWFEETQQLLSR
jgi:carbamoyltransferase